MILKVLNFIDVIFCEINRCLSISLVSLGMAMLLLFQYGDAVFTRQQNLFLNFNAMCLVFYCIIKFVEQVFSRHKSFCFIEWIVIFLYFLILQCYGVFHKMPYSSVNVEYVALFYGCVVLFQAILKSAISLWEEKRNES